MATKVLTTTISEIMATWLDQESKRIKKTKRAIIETALKEWQKKTIQKQIRKSYQTSQGDEELLFLAEAGLEDFLKLI